MYLEIRIDICRYLDTIGQLGMKREEQELDFVERAIRDFILENQKLRLTENQVVLAMIEKGVCARMTCLKKIKGLKERDIIEDIRAKSNNFSCLVVRNKNEFSKISNHLSQIESLIRTINVPTRKINQLTITKDPSAADYYANFLFPYIESISTMLRIILIRTDEFIHSKKDCQTIHTRIIKLMTTLTLQSYGMNNASHLFWTTKIDLMGTRKRLVGADARTGLITSVMIDELFSTIENFEKSFLPVPKWLDQAT